MLKRMLTHNKAAKAIALLLLVSTAVISQGCNRRNTGSLNFASHKVMLDRGGITNRFGVEERGQLAIFHYDGLNLSGDRLRVKIENDKVMVNDTMKGTLKVGDSVKIDDDGLTVNALDHGQTEKYLQSSLAQGSAQKLNN